MAQALKCLCCGEPMDVAATQSKKKPYAACEDCGVQVFVRGKKGVTLFNQKYGTEWQGTTQPPPTKKPDNSPAPAKKGEDDDDTFGW